MFSDSNGVEIMERIETGEIEIRSSTQVWSVADFAKRNNLDENEERRLRQLFGAFATAGELQHNVTRKPRWR